MEVNNEGGLPWFNFLLRYRDESEWPSAVKK